MPPSTPYAQLTPAPWKHPSELAMVRDWFYPEHLSHSSQRPLPFSFSSVPSSRVDRRQDAINLVSVWRFRDPKLAHALVCTARLTDAILHDQSGRRDQLSRAALCSIYAMNFCRFVNALVDRDVRKSVTATMAGNDQRYNTAAGPDVDSGPHRGQHGSSGSSMYSHALTLGLPESFVELRHQAIHEDMPSLEVLRMRTREALDWLWERWWKFNVKGSAEPALSEWEGKYGKWQKSKGQAGVVEEEGLHATDPSILCPTCRKRKSSEQEGRDEEYQSSGEGAEEENSRNLDLLKQQKLNNQRDSPLSSPRQSFSPSSLSQQRHEWTICFSRGLLR